MDYRPYRWTNHTPTHLLHGANKIDKDELLVSLAFGMLQLSNHCQCLEHVITWRSHNFIGEGIPLDSDQVKKRELIGIYLPIYLTGLRGPVAKSADS